MASDRVACGDSWTQESENMCRTETTRLEQTRNLTHSRPQTIDTVYHDGARSLVPMEKVPIDIKKRRNEQMIEIDGTKFPPARLSTGVERNRGGAREGGIVGRSKSTLFPRIQILQRSPLPPVIGNAQWPRALPRHP